MKILLKWLVLAVAILITTTLLPESMLVVQGGFKTYLLAALVLGVANLFVRPILLIVSLPLTILTLGLFSLVINALMLYLVAFIISDFIIKSFLGALIASIVISIVNAVLSSIIKG